MCKKEYPINEKSDIPFFVYQMWDDAYLCR